MKLKNLEKELETNSINELINAIVLLQNKNEAEQFLRDLLTKQEIIEFGKRFEAAIMLNKKISYIEIEKITGLSSTTIARISKWLKRGCGGYKLIINRIHHTNTPLNRNA